MGSRGDLKFKLGDTFRRTLAVTNADAEAENITGAGLTFTVRDSVDASINLMTKTLSITSAAQGLAVLLLTPTEVGTLSAGRFYSYEVEMVLAGEVSTVVEGRIFVEKDRG